MKKNVNHKCQKIRKRKSFAWIIHGCVQKCRSLDGCAPFSLPCIHIRIFSPDLFAEPLLSMYHDVHSALMQLY